MSNKINHYQGIIDFLNLNGLDICQVLIGDRNEFFVCVTLDPPISGSIQNSPFLNLEGWNVSELILNNPSVNVNDTFARIKKLMETSKKSQVQFSMSFHWILYKSN